MGETGDVEPAALFFSAIGEPVSRWAAKGSAAVVEVVSSLVVSVPGVVRRDIGDGGGRLAEVEEGETEERRHLELWLGLGMPFWL